MANISVSMATQLSNQDDLKSGAIIQKEGHTLIPPNGHNGPNEMEAVGSTQSHSPSHSLVRKPTPDCPETWYCLEIQVISMEDGGTTPPPPHAWQAPVVEDMLWDGKSGLTEVVVTGPGHAILFYGRWSLGEGLSFGKAWDTTFMLSGAISWVGKQAQLNTNAISLLEGQWLITQAIIEWCIEARGPRHPHSLPPASPPFSFCKQDESPWGVKLPTATELLEVPRCTHLASYHEWGWALQCSWDCGHRWWNPWAAPTLSPSPSPDHGFESDGSSVSTSSSVSSRSDRSGGLGHQYCGQHHWEPRGHVKINLLIFKDENKKGTVTIKVGIGISWCIIKLDAEIAPSSPMSSTPYRATQRSWWGAWPPISLWMEWSLCWMSTSKMSRLWTPRTRNFSNYKWLTKEQCEIGGCTSQDTSKALWPHSQKGSHQTTLLNWSETASMVDCPSSWRWWLPT